MAAERAFPLPDRSPRVFTIAPGAPFLETLADVILSGRLFDAAAPASPLDLARHTVLLPTRRSARALTDAFLNLGSGNATLLPRIRPVGDVDEDDFSFDETGNDASLALELLPPASGTGRQLILMRLLLEWAEAEPDHHLARALRTAPGQAVSLAKSLGNLIQTFETEEVPFARLAELRDGDYPEHRSSLLDFLEMVAERLPAELARLGAMGPAARRSLLIDAEARRLALSLPGAPLIAAGSTGSIPATARLLSVIARLPLGAVILPGLDQDLDDEAWLQLPQQHPQFGLKRLLATMEVDRREVVELPSPSGRVNAAKRRLFSEVMRPASNTERWRDLVTGMTSADLAEATSGLELIEAPGQREEALAIAMIMREVLETPGRTAALITPDRNLSRRVASELARWDIGVNDSAGRPLTQTPEGAFLFLLLDVALNRFAPVPVLSLLKHPLAGLGIEPRDLRRRARLLERVALRGLTPPPGIEGLRQALGNARRQPSRNAPRLKDEEWAALEDLLDRLESALRPLTETLSIPGPMTVDVMARAHLESAETVAVKDADGLSLWQGEAGKILASVFSGLLEEGSFGPPVDQATYPALLRDLMASRVVRPAADRHPRLAIYGLLEARLMRADVVILGGLNETIWPPVPQEDPWLNRPMRERIGLDLPERRLGLAAHDFVQAVCADRVYATWSTKVGGSPAVPSRWILRLKTLLAATGAEALVAPKSPWMTWVKALDRPDGQEEVCVPRPRPPLSMRPRRLSVTEIETWFRDPYAIFARHVLKLRPLDDLGKLPGPAERGVLVHAALQAFAERWPDRLPPDICGELLNCGRAVFADWMSYPDVAGFWWPQFCKMAQWFATQEATLREGVQRQFVELRGRMELEGPFGPFELIGRADRFDLFEDGDVRIVDYKTGTLPSSDQEKAGFSPQLPLEAAMVERGGFEALGRRQVRKLTYIRLTGGNPPGELRDREAERDKIDGCYDGLLQLIAQYDDESRPYLPRVRLQTEDATTDYDHLSRFSEWQALAAASVREDQK